MEVKGGKNTRKQELLHLASKRSKLSLSMPNPKALRLILSSRQQILLKQIVRCSTNPHRLVKRAQLVLAAAAGKSNTEISQQLELDRGQVRLWRNRWLAATQELTVAEIEGVSDKKLIGLIEQVLSDRAREGTPNFFSTEQVVQIVAIACETPEESERPVSHWTTTELAQEAIKRSIVEKISPRSVGRFLKRSHSKTASSSLLVKCQSR
jgi:putative transposase